MKAPALYDQLRLFSALLDRKAVANKYRALVLGRDHVRGMGLFGQMRRELEIGIDAEIAVDGDDFLQVLRSLPDADFIARHVSGALRWTCGAAKGHLSVMADVDIPSPSFDGPAPKGSVTAEFGEGLELAALACGDEKKTHVHGLQGVQLVNWDGKAYAYATDNKVLTGCALGPLLDPAGGTITLLPPAVACLAELLVREKEAMLTYDASSMYCVTPRVQLLLHQVAPLRDELAAIADLYTASLLTVPLPREAVAAFVKRAEALSEQQHAIIEISVTAGRLRWAFEEKAASSEEEFLVESATAVTAPPIKVVASQLFKVLPHSDKITFDYVDKKDEKGDKVPPRLILRGPRDFLCVITQYYEGT